MSRLFFLAILLSVKTINSLSLLNDDKVFNLLNVDIDTKLIEFERIANTIQSMPSGGMVSSKRRELTIRLAMRAIIDGIEGDFLETVGNCYWIFSVDSITFYKNYL